MSINEVFTRELADLDEAIAGIKNPSPEFVPWQFCRDYMVLCATKGRLVKRDALSVIRNFRRQIARKYPND